MPLTFDQLYYNGNPQGYTRYGRDMWMGRFTFGQFADDLMARATARGLSLASKRVLIVGCAYGFTVEELRARGVNAFGMDISPYAIAQVPASVAAHVSVGDMRIRSDLNSMRSLAGLGGNQKFDLIVDEDALTSLSDADAVTACNEMRRAGAFVAHRLTVHNLEQPHDYNIKSLAAWKALCDTGNVDWWSVYTSWSEV